MNGYDVIGDIHGSADKLEALLKTMGYVPAGGGYRPPQGRQAIFVGDLIDRGAQQVKVLTVVHSMVQQGHARAVMGNHEFNAIGFSTRGGELGDYLRPRSEKNRKQHGAFIDAVGLDSPGHKAWVEWFKSLPLTLDLGGLRVAHAWWDDNAVRVVREAEERSDGKLTDDFIRAAYAKNDDGSGSALLQARKVLTCGVEWELPAGNSIVDKEGHKHPDARLAVWRHWAKGLREIALVPRGCENCVPDIPVPDGLLCGPIEGAPIVFGHHWFNGPVRMETPKVACLDWSAAANGPLVAYRWDGESELSDAKFVAAGDRDGVS